MAKKKKSRGKAAEPSPDAGQQSTSGTSGQQPRGAAASPPAIAPLPAAQPPTTVPPPAAVAQPVGAQTSPEKQKTDLAKEVAQKLFIRDAPPVRPFPKRPGFLTIGRADKLAVNHFLLRIGKMTAFHYDIDIKVEETKVEKDPNVVDKEVPEEEQKDRQKNRYSRKIATRLNRMVFQSMIAHYSQNRNQVFHGIHPVYDGQKNMFTSKVLTGTESRQSIRLRVSLEGESRTFLVTIKLAETNERIDLDVLNQYHIGRTCDDEVVKKSILFINTLLRHNATMDWHAIGQSIFEPKATGQALGQTGRDNSYLLIMYGFYTSVRNLMIGPTLNVDRSAACFYDPNKPLIFIIGQILSTSFERMPEGAIRDSDRRKIKKELAGLQIEATHLDYGGGKYRKYRILGISRFSSKSCKFDWNEKQNGAEVFKGNVSIEYYFQKKYNKRLKYPQLPVLEVGNPNNMVRLPLEVCRMVSHQRLRRSMKNSERSAMTKISGEMPPHARFEYCKDFANKQFHTGPMAAQNRPFLSEFQIDIEKNFLEVDSRVIPPPQLKYSRSSGVTPQDGEWEMWKSRACFVRPASLDKWIVINLSFKSTFEDADVVAFVNDLRSQAQEMGMGPNQGGPTQPLNRVVIKETPDFNTKTQFTGIRNRLNTIPALKGLKMILFITPTKQHRLSDDIYGEIKRLGDVAHGLTTQCVNIDSIWNERNRQRPRKWNRSYLRQLMLKVNVKLGGTNVALLDSASMPSIMKKPSLMIVGADVNHPAPADKISPSIAALVGSYDTEFTNYYTNVTMQPKSREEMIKYLHVMMYDLLQYYRKKRQSLPQHIVFYRDGVSEGQFQHVIDNEYSLLTKAFARIDPTYKPKLTFIVVQKRHHTRFMVNRNGRNMDPGTVVEKDVTHKRDFDFYLCSHAGRIGTSRSAHYYVLADENGFTPNDMCLMTYYLCHLYQRCTKSVSIPAPVYYADLAAYRAKVHASAIADTVSETTSVVSGSEGGDQQIAIDSYKEAIKVTENQKERLYFC